MTIQKAIGELVSRHDLDEALMMAAMQEVMTGVATPAQIGALLVALRMKGETVTEIAAAAKVMRQLATPVKLKVERKRASEIYLDVGFSTVSAFTQSFKSYFGMTPKVYQQLSA